MRTACTTILAALCLAAAVHAAEEPKAMTDGWLRKMLSQFPQADADGDGALTQAEADAYIKRMYVESPEMWGAKEPPAGMSQWTAQVAMRDGVKLVTEVFLPPGHGPWPVVLVRTPYGRVGNGLAFGRRYLSEGFALVSQDPRGMFGSEGRFDELRSSVEDGYDTVEWVAAQPWCNGKVGMAGMSAPGITAKLAAIARPPHLVAVAPIVAASNVDLYWFYNGGVCFTRADDWIRARGVEVQTWPRPRLPDPKDVAQDRTLPAHADAMDMGWSDMGGWFDIFTQSSLDDFAALAPKGRAVLVIGANGHAPEKASDGYPPWSAATMFGNRLPCMKWLTGTPDLPGGRSTIYYYLMGDVADPSAPGNVWRTAHQWPLPHDDLSLYMTSGRRLQRDRPAGDGATLAYDYDPRAPVPTLREGPADKPSLYDRPDILRFESAPLDQALEVTGKVQVELFVTTDVPDTTFMGQLLDIYPDGRVVKLLDRAVMARYRDGLAHPKPLAPGEVARVVVDLWSTAIVFAPGHRIGACVTSSNAWKYEVHPNSFEPVSSYDDAPVAQVVVHVSGGQASRLILPVVRPGASEGLAR